MYEYMVLTYWYYSLMFVLLTFCSTYYCYYLLIGTYYIGATHCGY